MKKAVESDFASQVLEIAQSYGYDATREQDNAPFRLFGWFRGRTFKPDIVVGNEDRSAIVVVKSRSVMIYDVFLAHQARPKSDVGALICVPDNLFSRIRESAKAYAEELDVHLCSLSNLKKELRTILE